MKKRFPWETYDVIFYSEETALNSSPLVKEIGFWVKHFYRRNVRPQGPHQNSLPRLKTDNSFSSPQSCGKLETPPHPFPELQGLGLWSSHSCHLCHCVSGTAWHAGSWTWFLSHGSMYLRSICLFQCPVGWEWYEWTNIFFPIKGQEQGGLLTTLTAVAVAHR